MSAQGGKTCAECGEAAESLCSQCKNAAYCSRECQKIHWKSGHKLVCTGGAKAGCSPSSAASRATPTILGPASWAVGMVKQKQHEWLVDCYRMRVDDDYAWGGNVHGLYDPDVVPSGIVKVFLVFCKLAQQRKALHQPWNWQDFLEVAGGLLCYAFEKSDAQEKYGSENIFHGAMGGRSLRLTAEAIMGSSCSPMNPHSKEEKAAWKAVSKLNRQLDGNEALLADLGGKPAWLTLLKRVQSWLMEQGRYKDEEEYEDDEEEYEDDEEHEDDEE